MQTEKQADLFSDLSFDVTARQYLRSIARSAMIIVVVAVIGYLLSVADLVMGRPARAGLDDLSTAQKSLSVVMILVGLLINYFLYRFAAEAGKGLNSLDQQQLNSSFSNLKNYFVATTIIFVILLFCVLFLLLVLGTGLMTL